MFVIIFFFFNDTATTEIYTLSLHDALPISPDPAAGANVDHDARDIAGSCARPSSAAGSSSTGSAAGGSVAGWGSGCSAARGSGTSGPVASCGAVWSVWLIVIPSFRWSNRQSALSTAPLNKVLKNVRPPWNTVTRTPAHCSGRVTTNPTTAITAHQNRKVRIMR